MNNNKSSESTFPRSPLFIFWSSNESCTKCLNFQSNKVSQTKKMTTKDSATNVMPVKSETPISTVSKEEVGVILQHNRIANKSLK